MFPPTHPIYGAYRPRTRCCIQNKRAGLIAVIGICLFFCGILIAINTLYDLQTISIPIYTQYNQKVQDLVNDERRKLSASGDPHESMSAAAYAAHVQRTDQNQPREKQRELANQREREEAANEQRKQEDVKRFEEEAQRQREREGEEAERQKEEEEVQRVEKALLEYFQVPNRMSMYACPHPFPLTPGQAEAEVRVWLQKEGTEFIKTKFRKQHWKGQIDLQTCLTKLQIFLTLNRKSTWWVIIKEDDLDRGVQEKDVVDRSVPEKDVVDRIERGMLEYFSSSDRMCIINNFQTEPNNSCTTLDPEDAKQKVTLWMSNGGEEFIKCEFRKTGEQIDPLLYTDVLAYHSGTNSTLYGLYGGVLMMLPVTQRTPELYQRVKSC